MSLDDESFKRKIEEFKEIGHEYRYREQLMVQEFGLSMVAIATLLNVVTRDPAPSAGASFILQLFGSAFLALLALHLRNINQDRRTALHVKDAIRVELGFAESHQNLSGVFRLSAPRLIVHFALATAIVWCAWTAISGVQLVLKLNETKQAAESIPRPDPSLKGTATG